MRILAQNYSKELGLLRTIVRGLESRPMPRDGITQEYLRAESITLAHRVGDGMIVLNSAAADAFDDLSGSLVARSSAMVRGVAFDSVRSELLDALANCAGSDVDSISADRTASLHAHLEEWFSQRVASRQVFIPCAISPWPAPRFRIGPVLFIYMDDVVHSEFYPPSDNDIARHGFDRMLGRMQKSRAHWLACATVENCDRQKGEEEIGPLATDLAIVGLQLAFPLSWDTRTMARLDVRRGEAQGQTLSLSDGSYAVGDYNCDAGLPIGPGMMADILQKQAPVIEAAGNCVTSFATGQFRLPNLQQAWCDAAYWLHEALAETIDSIAVAKLETTLEVLVCAENAVGSGSRIESILDAFYGLSPNDMITSQSTTTTKQFVKAMVRDRSRILHGTWSTLNSHLAMNRKGMEEFVIEVIRRAALELIVYANTAVPTDETEAFLKWIKARQPTR